MDLSSLIPANAAFQVTPIEDSFGTPVAAGNYSGPVSLPTGGAGFVGFLVTFTGAQAPKITSVAASGITASGATVTWTTDVSSDTQVVYGATTAYGQSSSLNTTMTTAHSAAITGLAGGTTYHYQVLSRGASGLLSTSGDSTFTTLSAPPVISGVTASALTSSATIAWTTNIASDTQIDYGTTLAYGQSTALDTTMTTSHSAALSGLTAGTMYYYRVRSRSAAGLLSTWGAFSFATVSPAPVISSVALGHHHLGSYDHLDDERRYRYASRLWDT